MTPTELKKFRKKLDVSQYEFAEMLGYQVWTVNRWESGKVPIPKWMDIIEAALRPSTKGGKK